MSALDITERLRAIRAVTHDDEVAHSLEDGLRVDVLRAIANHAEDPAGLAAKALESEGIAFERLCS